MRRVQPFQLYALVLASPFFLQADDETGRSPLHQFTDKEGNQMEARVLSLSRDRRIVRIERQDRQTFDLEVTRLSLDDQQRLKDWLSVNQSAMEDLEVRLGGRRKVEENGRERIDGPLYRATWEKRRLKYEIAVTSLTTSDVSGLKLEYCLLLEDRISVRDGAEENLEDNPVRWRTQANQIDYFFGSVDLPILKYNRAEAVETGSLPIDSVRLSGGIRGDGEDDPIGVLARIVDAKGVTVAEFSHLDRSHEDLSWDAFESHRDPSESEGSGMLVDRMVSR